MISVPPSPLKKQPSRDSIQSVGSNVSAPETTKISSVAELPTPIDEEPIVSQNAPSQVSANSNLVHRHSSFTISAGEAKLGRIQLTLQYSVPRQKLYVHVHKIA